MITRSELLQYRKLMLVIGKLKLARCRFLQIDVGFPEVGRDDDWTREIIWIGYEHPH